MKQDKNITDALNILRTAACAVIRETVYVSRFDEMSDAQALLIHAIRRLTYRQSF